ncbi:MAG TPA: universal stress protein [Xanthobacteraceae bacterium]|nr:universal stress protein [Xanthobacteraceae bacterium]
MSSKRRSYEAGHRPKYLVVIDDSPECDRAVYYASRRAARTEANLIMLHVIEPHDRNQQWLGVADIMRAEAHEEANTMLTRFAGRVNGIAGITPERAIREGEKVEEILSLIEEDQDIAILVLAAGTGKEGPGPIVAGLVKTIATFPVPIAIVPGHLTEEELDSLS